MICRKCNFSLSDEAKFCANCGEPTSYSNTCAKCGATLNDGARFCEDCGEAVATTSQAFEAPAASGKTCAACGASVEPDTVFCENCGSPVAPAPTAKTAEGQIAQPAPVQPPITAPTAAAQAPAAQKKRSKLPAIIISAILGGAVAFGAIWYFFLSPTTSIKAVEALAKQQETLASANQLLSQSDYDKAIALYDELLKANPALAEVYLGLSDAYMGKNDKAKALEVLQTGYNGTQNEEIKNAQLRLGVMANGGKATVEMEQIDSTDYPTIRLYYRITNDLNGEPVYGLTKDDFTLSEQINGSWINREIKNLLQLETNGGITTTVTADASGSMDGQEKIELAKQVMKEFADTLQYDKGDIMEVISFDSFVREVHNFSDNSQDIKSSIDTITAGSQTALYDTLFAGTNRSAEQGSAKCIIAFTDGGDNRSSTSPSDVIDNAKRYSVPIFIIGFGGAGDINDEYLRQIADETGGFYKHISDLTELGEIYRAIYTEQKQLYMLEYETGDEIDRLTERGTKLALQSITNAQGSCESTIAPRLAKTDEDNIVIIKKDEDNAGAVHRYGNTTGNIANCGYMAQQGDWLYYRNSSDNNTLYKVHIDGSGKMKLTDDRAYSINVVNDVVYYSNEGANDAIYRVDITGANHRLVTSDSAFYLNVVDDYIYYRNSSENEYLYRIKTDGTGRQQLNSTSSWNINVIDDEIYFQARLGSDRPSWYLYKMNTDGSGAGTLVSDNVGVVIVVGDYVYYRNYSDSGKLYRVRKDGTDKRKLNDDMTFYTNITNNYIYYGNITENGAFYRVRTDGTERKKISDMPINFINIAGNRLVFESPTDKKIYVTDEYGSQAKPIN